MVVALTFGLANDPSFLKQKIFDLRPGYLPGVAEFDYDKLAKTLRVIVAHRARIA